MKIVIHGEEFILREKEVEIAKQAVNRFIKVIKEGSIENNMPTLYLALLAVMKAKSTDLLESLNHEQIAVIMRLLQKPDETRL